MRRRMLLAVPLAVAFAACEGPTSQQPSQLTAPRAARADVAADASQSEACPASTIPNDSTCLTADASPSVVAASAANLNITAPGARLSSAIPGQIRIAQIGTVGGVTQMTQALGLGTVTTVSDASIASGALRNHAFDVLIFGRNSSATIPDAERNEIDAALQAGMGVITEWAGGTPWWATGSSIIQFKNSNGTLWDWFAGSVDHGDCSWTNNCQSTVYTNVASSDPVMQGMPAQFTVAGSEFCFRVQNLDPSIKVLVTVGDNTAGGARRPAIMSGQRGGGRIVWWLCDWQDNGGSDANLKTWFGNAVKYVAAGANTPPVAVAGGNDAAHTSYSGNEGSAVVFDGSASTDANNDALTFAWDFGDGSSSAASSNATASHSYADNGTYTAKLTVTDSHGASTSATVQVTIANVAPTATFKSPANVNEGDSYAISLSSVVDPSSADVQAGFTYAFDCGIGYGAFGSSASATCSAPDNGSYAVRAKVRDKDGAATEYSGTVVAANVAPTVSAGAGATITSGDSFTLNGSFSDPGVNDHPWSYSIAWGAGSPTVGSTNTEGAITSSRQYLKAGTYTVSLSVTDKDNGTGSANTSVTVQRLSVGLDIKPGDGTNPIKLNDKSNGDVPVAVLSSGSFDARLVDVASVRIGGAAVDKKPNGTFQYSYEDVNGDGQLDLVLHFALKDLTSVGGLNASSTSLTLLADLTDGRQIVAQDAVKPL